MHRISLYKLLINQSFFIDKCSLVSNYQCPKIKLIQVRVGAEICSSFFYYKLLILFYLLSGQKPVVLIKICSLRGIKKKKVTGFLVTLRKSDLFLYFFIFRQLPLVPFFKSFSLKGSLGSTATITLQHRTQDDDTLPQLLRIAETFSYSITFHTTATNTLQLRTLLTNFKIPSHL